MKESSSTEKNVRKSVVMRELERRTGRKLKAY